MGLFDAFKKKSAPAPAKAAPAAQKLSESEVEMLVMQGRAAYKTELWETAGQHLEKAAKAGSAEAKYWLGKLCERGSYSGYDTARAKQLSLQAAEGGVLEAMSDQGDIYYYGLDDQEMDGEKAYYWYTRVVDWRPFDEDDEDDEDYEYNETQKDALQALGNIYYLGCGQVACDEEKMVYWTERAARSGCQQSMFNLGCYYRYGIDEDEETLVDAQQALYWFAEAASSGMTEGAVEMGRMFEEGIGMEVDLQKARELYESVVSAEGEAGYRLGMMYKEGRGVTCDYEQAFKRFYDAALQGDRDASLELALAYGRGRGTLADAVLAYRCAKDAAVSGYVDGADELVENMERALSDIRQDGPEALLERAKKGDAMACYCLAFLYEAGLDVKLDAKQAFSWYVKALESGNQHAIYRMARMYETGEGVETDPAFAVKMYGKAANLADWNAVYRLGELCFERGDDEGAVKMYTMAAEHGHSRAMYQVFKMYAVGRGVEANRTVAMEWLHKANEARCPDAITMLEQLNDAT